MYSTFELVTPEGAVPTTLTEVVYATEPIGFVVEVVHLASGVVAQRSDGTGPWSEVV